MFGKGVYFADTPMKSWQYGKHGYILQCSVELGRVRRVYKAWSGIDPNRDLRPNWVASFMGEQPYNSVQAMTRAQGGAVNLPELTVYQPERALPRYVLKCREER